MPSSMIFVGLVVLWLLILVPAVARRQQEVARPSPAALSGRVLARSRRQRSLEVYQMDLSETQAEDVRAEGKPPGAEPGDSSEQAHGPAPAQTPSRAGGPAASESWEPGGFRRGRGGFDAEAAALAARARYAFRQRIVLGLLVLVVASALFAGVAWPTLWWAHGAFDVMLVSYLVYLRRQVRLEEAIRARRAARMAGTRRARPTENDLHPGIGPDADEPTDEAQPSAESRPPGDDVAHLLADDDVLDDGDWTDDDGARERVHGTGEPVGVLPARRRTVGGEDVDEEIVSALPPLEPSPTPPLPEGTQLVDVDAEEDELAGDGLGDVAAPRAYLRAAGE